ncbi:MAG: hypothetical protein ACOYNG_08885 [Terrimicrobiaceae bacterium]|jgi:Rod binding domain-containing protein
MDFPAIQPISAGLSDPALAGLENAMHGSANAGGNEKAKIAESCHQFEAILWRQLLDKALQPMLHSPEFNTDKTGTYGFFLSNTISESVSGSPSGLSSLLQAQLLKNQTSTKL